MYLNTDNDENVNVRLYSLKVETSFQLSFSNVL